VTRHLVQFPCCRRIDEHFGRTTVEQLTCDFHIHAGIASREEGVAVLDLIRIWLPVVLALSADSPFLGRGRHRVRL
jgi:carboxylate-amine ligase